MRSYRRDLPGTKKKTVTGSTIPSSRLPVLYLDVFLHSRNEDDPLDAEQLKNNINTNRLPARRYTVGIAALEKRKAFPARDFVPTAH